MGITREEARDGVMNMNATEAMAEMMENGETVTDGYLAWFIVNNMLYERPLEAILNEEDEEWEPSEMTLNQLLKRLEGSWVIL